ncbi:MAG: DUF938 domain-containing protein [Pseudomonadota bacterium]
MPDLPEPPGPHVPDARRYAPAVARNRDAIRDALLSRLPERGAVLEIASGTGEHGTHLTAAAPGLRWTYSDPDPDSRASQKAWADAARHGRLLGPLAIDACAADWSALGGETFDAVFCANMVHIAPFAAAEGLITGARRHLTPGGLLVLYGPFARNGDIAPSNQAFSDSLTARAPDWGVRDLDLDIIPVANRHAFALDTVIPMPANNLMVLFQSQA